MVSQVSTFSSLGIIFAVHWLHFLSNGLSGSAALATGAAHTAGVRFALSSGALLSAGAVYSL